ncbi:MAG TPA: hypothetical protein VFA04_07980 [Bryobacteraceae bacterium]|nr:hypothetical protein [Bryobacteraceae bacterium]
MKPFVCAWLAICPLYVAQEPVVTQTKVIKGEDWKTDVTIRRINGRWWSPDDREVYPPSSGSFFWTLDSKPGVVRFFHHRPFQLALAESLHLFMAPDEVKAALGQPNRIFGQDAHAVWYYYAANGTKLSVRFMDGVLGEATYYSIGETRTPVASIERELDGRSIYKVMADRAARKTWGWQAQKAEENRIDQSVRSAALRHGIRPGAPPHVEVVTVAAAEPARPAAKRLVSAAAVSRIAAGERREDVLSRLGEPRTRYSITGDDGVQETFAYDLDSGENAIVRLLDGKVTEVRRQ